MQPVDDQRAYWDRVAYSKEFTHPLKAELLTRYLSPAAALIDYGCGYGRIVRELLQLGYVQVRGFDTSQELIKRGRNEHPQLPIFHLNDPAALPVETDSVDGILLFAVLTCIPSNQGQCELMHLLRSKLKPGGMLYISDYYLQPGDRRYGYLEGDAQNYGVFTASDGTRFRHHEQAWIGQLLTDFSIVEERAIEVYTMNGHRAAAFQLIASKA